MIYKEYNFKLQNDWNVCFEKDFRKFLDLKT